MRARAFIATAVLATLVITAPLATAQDRQRRPPRADSGGGGSSSQGGGSAGPRTAAPREGGRVQQAPRESSRTEPRESGRREVTPPPAPAPPPQPAKAQPRREPPAATPRGSSANRDDGRNDARYDANGRYAVPRTGPVPYYRDGDRRVYAQPGQNYYVYRYPSYRYAYPYRYTNTYRYYGYPYPYYGYAYYDPGFTGSFYWSNHAWQSTAYPAYSGGGYVSSVGKLRLQVQPREAEVYIDGYYAGVVDEFDGRLQGLQLEAGNYAVEIALPGFAPLQFNVAVQSGRTTTYRGELAPEP